MSLHDDRKEYRANSLSDEAKSADPVALFSEWLESYRQTGVADATAFALSTVSSDGHPDARIVLLKALEQGRMQFFTHYTSKKGRDLAANPFAHALFFWPSQERQVRVFALFREWIRLGVPSILILALRKAGVAPSPRTNRPPLNRERP